MYYFKVFIPMMYAFFSRPTYSSKEGEGLLVNILGLMIVVFALGVTFLLSKFEKNK